MTKDQKPGSVINSDISKKLCLKIFMIFIYGKWKYLKLLLNINLNQQQKYILLK